jgi:hypothetical protein
MALFHRGSGDCEGYPLAVVDLPRLRWRDIPARTGKETGLAASYEPAPSLNDLVSSCEQGIWNRKAEHLCGFEIDYKFEFGRLLDW